MGICSGPATELFLVHCFPIELEFRSLAKNRQSKDDNQHQT